MIDRYFEQWTPFDAHSTKNFFYDIADLKKYKTFLLLETIDSQAKIRDSFFYTEEDFPANFVLSFFDILVGELARRREAIVFDELMDNIDPKLKEVGIVAGMAYPILLGETIRGILMVCTRTKQSADLSFESIFKAADRSSFNAICERIAPFIKLELCLESKDYALYRKLIGMSHDLKTQLNIAKSFIGNNYDLPIDILENVANKSTSSEIKNEVVSKYSEIMSHFMKHLQNEPKRKELNISSPFLLSYFLHCFIKEFLGFQSERVLFGTYCCEEQIDLYRHLATAIKFYFYNMEDSDQVFFRKSGNASFNVNHAEFFNSICYLISEFSCLKGNLDRQLNVESHLKKFISSQTVLYSLQDRYRDHIFHMIDICLLGLYLLENGFLNILSKVCKMDDKVIFKNWFVASLLHDIGYVAKIYDLVDGEIVNVSSAEIDAFMKRMTESREKGIIEFTQGAIEKLKSANVDISLVNHNSFNHGVISALHILDTLSRCSIECEEYHHAIMAIAVHDLPKYKLNIKDHPIAVLLAICDELQDWERPSIEKLPFKERVYAAIKYGGSLSVERKNILDMMTISLDKKINPYASGANFHTTKKMDLVYDYREAAKQVDFSIFYPWLLKSYKLQRIDLRGVFDIYITFQSKSGSKDSDFVKLRKNRRREMIWSFEKWFKMIQHNYDRGDDNTEKVSISVRELYRQTPLIDDPAHYLMKLL